MARIPEEQIDRIKREVSLERLISGKGIALSRKGRDLVGLCPFHNEDTPSLIVSPQKNLFHCMGCGAAGSVIDWVMRIEGISFRHAVELLCQDVFSLAAPLSAADDDDESGNREIKVVKRGTVPKLEAPFDHEAEDHELTRQVIGFYHEKLKETPDALAYLEKRGLVHGELIDQFKLGFADRTLGYRLPQANRVAGAEVRGRLQELGFLRDSGHEHFRGSLVVPIFDEKGHLVQCYGRKINDNLRKGTPMHLYLPGPHRAVWNLPALQACEEIILCESLIDAMTFWVHGFRNVTTSFGIRGFLKEVHLAAFEKHGIKRVLIAYDRDEPGEKAAQDLIPVLNAAGIGTYRIQFPKGMDANSYACTMKPPAKALELLIRSALMVGDVKLATERGQLKVLPRTNETPSKPSSPSEPLAAKEKLHPGTEETALEQKPPEPRSEPMPFHLAAASAAEPDPPKVADKPVEPMATPVPKMPQTDLKAVIKEEDIFITRGDRSYRIRNLEQNLSRNVMKVNVMAYRGEVFHMDVLNLYSAYHRTSFAKMTAKELETPEEVIEKDLGKLLLKLEELQDQQIKQVLAPPDPTAEMSEAERADALAFLKAPHLFKRILADYETCGIVGEETNKLVGYLVAVSRKLPQPLGALIQSSSASGKTTTMDSILAFVPKEDLVKYSAITGQALYYKGESDLQNKIIAIVEEEGAEKASYPLKLLLSEGELIIASTGKNQMTGNHATQDYHVKGPVAVFVTTTAVETDEEFQNRCLVLTVDESRAQTQAIHKIQREKHTLEGLKRRLEKDRILKVHQNAQRLLRPVRVVNPFAPQLTFLDDKTRMRRDQEKYLNLIDACAFLHQYQRTIRTTEFQGEQVDYIEATLEDIEMANRLAHEVLGRSLDELPPQTRKLLGLVHEMVLEMGRDLGMERADIRFSRREVREYVRWGNTQLKVHLRRLEEMEYLLTHRGKRGQSFEYELLYKGEGQGGHLHKPFLMGLLDVASLKESESKLPSEEMFTYDEKKSAQETKSAGLGRPQNGAEPVSGRGPVKGRSPLNSLALAADWVSPAANSDPSGGARRYPPTDTCQLATNS